MIYQEFVQNFFQFQQELIIQGSFEPKLVELTKFPSNWATGDILGKEFNSWNRTWNSFGHLRRHSVYTLPRGFASSQSPRDQREFTKKF